MLPGRVTNLDEIPEDLREHYVQKDDGVWELGVEDAEDVYAKPLSRALTRLKDDRANLREELKGLKPFQSLLKEHPEVEVDDLLKALSKGDKEDDGDGKTTRRQEEVQLEKLTTEISDLKRQLDQARVQRLNDHMRFVARKSLRKHGGEPELLEDQVLRRISGDFDDKENVVISLSLDDAEQENFDFPETVDALVAGLKKHKVFQRGFDDFAGVESESAEDSGKTVRISREEAQDPKTYRAAKDEAFKKGYEFVVEGLGESA